MPATQAIAAIEAGPKGPDIGAFFDFDGTLIDGYSAAAYFTDKLRRREMSLGEAANVIRLAWRGDMDESEFAHVIGKAIAAWADHPEQELAELWSRLFRNKIASLLFPQAWRLVKAHQKMGHTLVIASSATRYQAAPIAEELGIGHVLCTRATVRDGRLTGHVEGAPLWGAGKAQSVCDFAKAHGVALARSYGYANGNEDIAFLKTVGACDCREPETGADRDRAARGLERVTLPGAPQSFGSDPRAQLRCLLRARGHLACRPRLRGNDREQTPGRRMGRRDEQRYHAGDHRHRR